MRQLLVLLVVAASLAAPAAAAADPGDVLVRFRPGTDAAERADARRDADVRRETGLPVTGLEVVDPQAGVSAPDAIAALERRREVLYAEPDVPRRAFARPDDPLFGFQWGLLNTGQEVGGAAGTPDADIDATDAWDVETGSSSVVVAVIDSGVADHRDLVPNLFVNGRETPANGVDDDGNGFVDDVRGWDFTGTQDNDPDDADGHGTHVAGTIGARGDDGEGVTGVAWQTSLLPVRALGGEEGTGSVSDAIRAYGYAARTGARVANLSFGGGASSRAERDALTQAPGVLFVAAAGNEGADNDATPSFPCNYDLPNVICVAASDRSDGLADFSNRGDRTVDLAAPGVAIASTFLGGDHALLNGTSMAAPHVSGAAALLLAARPAATVADLRRVLLGSVDPRPALVGTTVTGGRLNVAAALRDIGAVAPAGAGGASGVPAPSPAPGPSEPPAEQATPGVTATAPAGTAAPVDRSAPMLSLSTSPARDLGALLRRRGLRVRVRCSERCTLRLALRRGRTTIASGRASRASAGTVTVTLRVPTRQRARLRRLRSVRLELRTTATDRFGNRRTVARRLVLRR